MNEMLASGDQEKIDRVVRAFLTLKRFDLKKLKKAYEGT
jgi:hypothetical protein